MQAIDIPASGMDFFFDQVSPLAASKVDRTNGVVRGVSVITAGIQAKGHDLHIDDTTLSQMLSCAQGMGQVPVKWNHRTGADAVNGFLNNFRLDGNRLRADWHLLKSHSQYETALELCERMPQNVGLSAAFRGKEEVKAKKKFARCEEVVAVDLVAQPAANPDGLFEEGPNRTVDTQNLNMPAEPASQTPAQEPSLADVIARLDQINTRIDGIEAGYNEVVDHLNNQIEGGEGGEGDFVFDPQSGAVYQRGADGSLTQVDPSTIEGLEGFTGQNANGSPNGAQPASHVVQPLNGDAQPAMAGAGASTGAELAAIENALIVLHDRMDRREAAELEAAEERALSVIEQKFRVLSERIVQLSTENQALTTALKTAGSKPVSAGGDSAMALPQTHLSRGGDPLDEWETKVKELEAGGKSATEAITFAIKEHADLYRKHQERIGVVIEA